MQGFYQPVEQPPPLRA